jgi:transmembrane sensor
MNPRLMAQGDASRGSNDPVDEVAVERMWRAIAARRARSRSRLPLACAVAVAAAAVTFAWLHPRGFGLVGGHPQTPAAPGDDGLLRLADGAPISVLTAPDAPRAFVLSDASHVEISRGGVVEPSANGRSAVSLRLVHGAATFDVVPGGSRRWSIECGHVVVDVIGTRFQVTEDGSDHVHVGVEHGVVLVRGDRVPGHVVRLVDGQSIDVEDAAQPPPKSRTVSVSDLPAAPPDPPRPTDPAPASSTPAAPHPWKELASNGSYDDAYRSLGASGVAREVDEASVEDLLALADVARLSGHAADAVLPLSRVLERPKDPRAPLAAFTLGRLELDNLGDPSRAALAFERAIALGLPGGLAEDAYARLVEARSRAGDGAGARAAASEYAQKYPNGSRASTIQRWVGD